MNVSVENLATCKKLMRVEIDAQAVDVAFENIVTEFQHQVSLPGFRPGKSPRATVVKRFEKEIADEVKRKLISDAYRKAVTDQKLNVIGYPDIEEIQFGRGLPLQFAATIETAPEFELPEYKGLPARRETGSVTDADVERALDLLRNQQAKYEKVDRPLEAGDIAVVNYQGTCEGKPITDLAPTARGLTEQKNFWVNITKDSFIPGFADQLIGAKAGDRRTVTVDFAVDFVTPEVAGKKGDYEVEIVEVKVRVLPEFNDAFAKSYGAENVEKLRAGVRADLENELTFKQNKTIRTQLARALLEKMSFELPESVVLGETKNIVYDIVRENQQRGVTREVIERQKDEIYAAANQSAKERAKAAFVFRRIAEKENIKVSQEELTRRIVSLAGVYQTTPDKFVKELEKRDGLAEIHNQVLNEKVLDFLQQHAKIQDVAPAPKPA